MSYETDEGVVLTATFTDDGGNAANPTEPVEVRVRRPDGEVDGPFTMQKRSTGVYEYTYTVEQEGWHDYVATDSATPPIKAAKGFEGEPDPTD